MDLSRLSRRITLSIVTVVTSLVFCLEPLTPVLANSENPVPVNLPGLNVAVVGNLPEAVNQTYRNVYSSLTQAGVVALTNAAQLFLGQIAYDAAEYIATGGKGQGKLFFDGKFGEYLSNVGGDAAGEFMAQLSDSQFFQGLGLNLCQPGDPTTLLRLQVSLGDLGGQLFPTPNIPGVASAYNRPQARCDFQQVVQNYSTLYRTMSNGDIVNNLERSFDPGLSQLGTITSVYNRFLTDTQRRVTEAAQQRQEGNGFRGVEGLISGNIRTPASVVAEATSEQAVRRPGADQSMMVNSILSNAANAGPAQLAMYTASIFLNTLASKFLKRIFEEGLGGGFTLSAGVDLSGPDSIAIYGKTDIRNANIDLKNRPAQQTTDYDVVSQMQDCLPGQRGEWSCTLDQSLVSAIRSKGSQGGVTVREALERGFLHPEWRLIPASNIKDNQDDQCYTRAYCAGNLQKMRLMRILPLGFEFAANSPVNEARCQTAQGCVTLKEAFDGFSVCNEQGLLDEQHPWCHLIDPNWVVTSFPQQCTLTGYTDTLTSSKLPIRRQECQDVQTCLSRDDKGQCTGGYGYCMAERSVYRFQADVCPAYAASCRTYTDTLGKKVSYLRNTLDRATCDASNAGCLWYATSRVAAAPTETSWTASTSTGDRMYFKAQTASQSVTTKGLESCPAGDEGCTKLYAFTPGRAALNLLINGSFETPDVTVATDALGWQMSTGVSLGSLNYLTYPNLPQASLGTNAFLGTKALTLSSASPATNFRPLQVIPVVGGRQYAFSFYARSTGGSSSVNITLAPSQSPTSTDATHAMTAAALGLLYRSSNLEVLSTGSFARVPAFRAALYTQLASDWARHEYTFVVPSTTQSVGLIVQGENVNIDALQFEEGQYATPFVETFSAGLQTTFMKIAPEELQCSKADVSARSPLCDKFAQTCNQVDAGCQGYQDKQGGGQEIPAVLSANDLCPASCVGYSEYRKAASSFDLVKDTDTRFNDPAEATSTYFIPSTASQCTQADVGCEAFTVLNDTGASDGTTAAYSYLRSCEKPGTDSETYFTWEGADTVGYQLRTWSLKKDMSTFDLGPRILTKIQADQISFKEPATCNEATWKTAIDPDCRQFYDTRGRIFYRYFSQTILSSASCTNLRMQRSSEADCSKTGGTFNASGECTYGAFLPESRTCRVQATSCRMFQGASAGNSQVIFNQTFRDGAAPFESAGLSTSTEALLVGDVSVKVGDPGSLGLARARTSFASAPTSLYRVTFWAKAPATSTAVTVATARQDGTNRLVVGTVGLTPEWQRFTVGLFQGAANASTTQLAFTGPILRGTSPEYGFYLDEVSLVRVQDVVYVRNNTWNTPNECNQGSDGASEPQAMLGCKAYTNRLNQTVNARRFTRLCRETAIGCTAFIDTRNTDETYARTIVQPNPVNPLIYAPSVIVRPADRYLYLIDDLTKRCDVSNMSCRAFGMPNLSPDRQRLDAENPYRTVYFKDDIARYDQALCKPSEAYCAEYQNGTAKEYFRAPGNSLCEYRAPESTVVPDDDSSLGGWFVKGSVATPCYPNIIENGNAFGLAKTGDSGYRGFVGACPEAASECTEIRDTSNLSDPTQPAGKSYYYIKNDRLDASSCNGTVDVGSGCVLFRDMSSGALPYSARATYQAYNKNGYRPTTPIDCQNNPENPDCRPIGRCEGQRRTYIRSYPSSAPSDRIFESDYNAVLILEDTDLRTPWTGGSCSADVDCQPPAPVNSVDTSPAQSFTYRVNTASGVQVRTTSTRATITSARCIFPPGASVNDSNLLLKVSVDRECSQWLGCRSSETVIDPSTGRQTEICSVPALCNRASNQVGDKFCAGYVDRTSSSTEPILTKGKVLNAAAYANRPLGLGRSDYSGYTLPNSFQVMDLQSVRVAIDGASETDPTIHSRFTQDYRLTGVVTIPPLQTTTTGRLQHTRRPTENEAKVLGEFSFPDAADGLQVANRLLKLCKHVSSGRIGYYLTTEAQNGRAFNCYLPVQTDSDLVDFQKVSQSFKSTGKVSSFLTEAYPPAECRAQPEQDSPFPASFTTEWDVSKNPPKPVRRLAGFTAANACEFGEDCSCTYKRVEYADTPAVKFYNQYSENVAPGICLGGPRDGQACIPQAIFNAQVAQPATEGSAAGSRLNAIQSANAEQLCGPPEQGGRCMPFKTVTLVRGTFGQCLERDITRTIGQNKDLLPCLTWNPSLQLIGDKDPYHYAPEAGYMPPQNSGQYYCLSNARKPKSVTFTDGSFATSSDKYSGEIKRLYYDDAYVSDGSGTDDGDEVGARIDGGTPSGSGISSDCAETDDDQEANNQARDPFALRIVNTGRGADQQYTESFFKINANDLVSKYYGTTPPSNGLQAPLSDINLSYIGLTPIRTRNATARLGCGYNADWVDNVPAADYTEISSVRPADTQWQNGFNAQFKGVLTRSSTELLTNPPARANPAPAGSPLLKANCVSTLAEYAPGTQCYFKTWETNYRYTPNTDKPGFHGLSANSVQGALRDLDSPAQRTFEDLRQRPLYAKCESQKPYFSVRAVFQSLAGTEDLPTVGTASSVIKENWTLAGFWVTACGGQSTDEHYIYMYVSAEYGDVCTELAEVVSKDSHQNAAFTDRVWKDGNFTIPVLGISYNARYAPFSSALNTRAAGVDPLFQTGQEVAGYSPLNPPTFLAAGYNTYFSPNPSPKDKWGYLTNIFARVYRIYRYQEQRVDNDSVACLTGPNQGKSCTPSNPAVESSKAVECSLNGICSAARLANSSDATLTATTCNALSGLNTGLKCLTGSLVEACHQAPMQLKPSGAVALRQLPCLTTPGWSLRASDGKYIRRDADDTTNPDTDGAPAPLEELPNEAAAAARGLFRCPDTPASLRRIYHEGDSTWRSWGGIAWDTALQGAFCSRPTDQGATVTGSVECPERIINGLEVAPATGNELGAPGPSSFGTVAAVGSRTMTATCVGATASAPGKCNIRVPEYNMTLKNRKTFRMESFTVDPTVEPYQYGECYSNMDCSFTGDNFYLSNPPAGTIPAVSYGSSRSIRSSNITNNPGGSQQNDAWWNTHFQPSNGHAPTGMEIHSTVAGMAPGEFGGGNRNTFLINVGNAVLNGGPSMYESAARIARYGLGTRINRYTDGNGSFPGLYGTFQIGSCVSPVSNPGVSLGICTGGRNDGRLCTVSNPVACISATDDEENRLNKCGVVSTGTAGNWTPVPLCRLPGAGSNRQAGLNGYDLNTDNNSCTHESGYVPRTDLCPDPNDQFCGLVSYNVHRRADSIDPAVSQALLPTDVTPGLHKIAYLLGRPTNTAVANDYQAIYIPRPPMVAAPDVKACSSAGQCAVQALNKISLDGSTEGAVNVAGAQAKSTLRFYAWASHNQMPLRSVSINWGDGQTQTIADGMMKNRKPYCGVRKECVTTTRSSQLPNEKIDSNGLTCNTDNDCPVGGGSCQAIGTCKENSNITCSTDAHCRTTDGSRDTCEIRTMFGNTQEACEENYFEFTHVYACTGPANLPLCNSATYGRTAPGSLNSLTQNASLATIVGRCERDPDRSCDIASPSGVGTNGCAAGDRCLSGLAPTNGCWDPAIQTCRYTPKVNVQDNWGWCTGECRADRDSGNAPTDIIRQDNDARPSALHTYGGCYSATPVGAKRLSQIRENIQSELPSKFINECEKDLPSNSSEGNLRPWVVYSGSINLRSSR